MITLLSRAALLGGASLAVVSPAVAEEAADSATIIVTAPAADAQAIITRTPGGADVVTHAEYADRVPLSLRDTLAFTPGIYLQPRYGQEIRISIRGSGLSRGFHMRGLTLLQDGVPINLADDNGDFQELEPIFFDRLEVLRGSNALSLGSGTLGGAVNGITPRGRDARGLYARLDVGSFETARGLVSYGVAKGNVDAWAAISADTSNGDRDHVKRDSLRFHGNVAVKFSDVASSRFYVSINRIDQEIPGALTRTQALTTPRMASAAALSGDQARDIDSLRFQNRTSFDWGTATLDVGGFVNAKSLYHPIFQVIDQDSVDVGGFFRGTVTQGPVEFVLGGEIRRGRTDARQYVNIAGARGARTFDADLTARTANLYGEVRVQPVERVTLIAGGVWADGFRRRTVNQATAASASGGVSFDAFSPKFGLLIAPNDAVQIFANVSRSAEFPGFGEVFQSIGTPPVSTIVPGIKPQRAWTAEIGTRGAAGPVRWDLALYRSTLTGELLQFTTSASIPAATFNADKTLHQGIEAALEVDASAWIRLRGIYTFSDFRFRNDTQFGNNRLPVIPRHVLRGEVRLGTDTLHVAPHIEWQPQGAYADYRNTTRTPGYALLGLSGSATVARGVDLFVDARNLTGKKAIGDISAVIAATAGSAIYYPVERRSVYGGVRARF